MSVKSFKTSGVGVDLAPKGLVLINTTSFSGVASQALPASTFNATYENYLIVLNITACSADAAIYLKMRTGVTDSSSLYNQAAPAQTVTGLATNFNQNGSTLGFYINEVDGGNSNHFHTTTLFLNSPFLSSFTTHTFNSIGVTAAGLIFGGAGGGVHGVATSYDSANIIASAGNITGKVSVYGINF